MEKLTHINNVVHTWLDDHEIAKFTTAMVVTIISTVGMANATNKTIFVLALLPVLITFASRWHYVVRGKYLGTR
jgi:hypothetical protein